MNELRYCLKIYSDVIRSLNLIILCKYSCWSGRDPFENPKALTTRKSVEIKRKIIDIGTERRLGFILSGKIIAFFGKHIKVYHQDKEYNAVIRRKLLKDDLKYSPVSVGDDVEFTVDSGGQAVIEKVLPRTQFLARPDVLDNRRVQVIAANLDQLVIITSTSKPRFKPGLVDRFLVSAEYEDLKAVIIINKIDLVPQDEFKNYASSWNSLGYNVAFTSAKNGLGLDDFKTLLKDKTSVLAGHSGVGKSSLLNAIQPSLNLHTREISAATGRGVHATASVRMYPLNFGGWVVDTPGLKAFGLSGINRKNLWQYFPEIKNKRESCRFDDCLHINEPGCAIKEAVGTHVISEFRYSSYKRIWKKLSN